MIEVTYLNTAKQEKHTSFEDYNEFVRAQQACWIALPDSTPVTKVTINGHDIGYKDNMVTFTFLYYEVRLGTISVIIREKNQTSCSGSFSLIRVIFIN